MSAQTLVDRKSRFADILLNSSFHVYDVSMQTPIALSLVYGFQQCNAPEKTVNLKKVKEGTSPWPYYVFESAETNEITMTRGAKFFDSDFDDWIEGFVKGETGKRRNLLLVQYSQINSAAAVKNISSLAATAIDGLANFKPVGDLISKVPARAWLLTDCVPSHYKAASDFDAQSGAISTMSLSVKPRRIQEFNTGV